MRSFSLFAALSASIAILGVAGLTVEERPPVVYVPLEKRGLEKRHYGSFVCRDQTYNNQCKTLLQQQGTSTATVGCGQDNYGRDQCYATCVSGYTRSADGSLPLCTLNCASGLTLSADRTTCVDLTSDVNNCGQLSRVCNDPANGSPTCTSGNCGIVCDSGFTNRNGACTATVTCQSGYTLGSDGKTCVNLSNDVNNCGTVGKVCPDPANGSPTCSNKVCGIACDSGYQASGSSCVSSLTCKDGSTLSNGSCSRYGCTTTAQCLSQTGSTSSYCTQGACFTPSSNGGGLPAGAACGPKAGSSGDDNQCAAGLICINYACSSPFSSDVNNCGRAGTVCPASGTGVSGAQCVSSSCQVTCGSGYTQSTDKKSCVSTTNDPNNCGGVGTTCPATGLGVNGAQCVNSSCQVTCGPGYTQSTDKKSCVSTSNDPKNCGAVGTVCPTTGTGVSGAQCVSSSCQVTCGSGYTVSADKKSCVSTTNDPNNCGAVGTTCPATGLGVSGAQCVNSSCQVTCGPGYTQSTDKKSCVSTTNDPKNCGAVGTVCPTTGTGVNGAQCVSSSCQVTCGSGYSQSADKKSCVATSNDIKNCGSVGNVCVDPANGSPTCTAGTCGIVCDSGYSPSNGACTSSCKDGTYYAFGSCVRYGCLSTADCQNKIGTAATGCYLGQCYTPSSNNAGLPEGSSCGNTGSGADNSCAANLVCYYGTCYNVFKSDAQNCGSYGNACPSTGNGISTSTCSNSKCVVTCSSGYTLGSDSLSCVSTSSDPNNCGAIGKQCPAAGAGIASSTCKNSACVITCSTGYTLSADKQSCTLTSTLCKDGAIPNGSGGCMRATCSTASDCVTKTGIAGAQCNYNTCYAPSSNSAGLPVGSKCGVGAETAPPGNDNTCVTGAICIDYVCKRAYNDVNNCGSYQYSCAANAGTGYVANSAICTNGQCTVTCTSLYNSVNGACVLKASAAPRQKKRAQKPITLCPAGETACPIAGSASFGAFSQSHDKTASFGHAAGGYECLDTSSTVESCGGCASTGEGLDCTRIKHSSGVGCSAGQCVVLSCEKGYAVSASGSKCLKIHVGAARRHKGTSHGLIH